MNSQQLRNSILQMAIQGKLVPQDPNDEPENLVIDKSLYKGKVSILEDEEYPFQVPSNWKFCRLQDIALTIGGYAFSAQELKDTGVRVIRISDVTPSGFSSKNIVRYNGALTLEQYQIKDKDILIAMTGGTVGKSYLVTNLTEKLLLNQRVAIVRANAHILPRYLSLIIQSPLTQNIINERKNSTNDNISMVDIRSFPIPLPPLSEQKRIVAKLEELLPLVEQYGKAQDHLDALNADLPRRLRQSILQEAIQGKLVPQDPNDEPASVLLERIRKEKEQLVKDGKLKKKDLTMAPVDEDEVPFDIPQSWEWCKFGDIVSTMMGKTPPRNDSNYWQNGVHNWVAISDMKDYGHIRNTKEFVSEYAAAHAFREKSKAGDLLMSFKLTVGRTSILEIPAYHNEAIITINPYIDDNFAFRNFLFYLLPLIANMGESKDAIKGRTLNSTSIYNLPIPLPPLAEQRRIVAKIEELFNAIDKIN